MPRPQPASFEKHGPGARALEEPPLHRPSPRLRLSPPLPHQPRDNEAFHPPTQEAICVCSAPEVHSTPSPPSHDGRAKGRRGNRVAAFHWLSDTPRVCN
ncbi:hypothetical protein AAFF_G00086280 [Aldrovandia affinis]|uniref:Uncharacterized protein n=1 Tax=Aldrovandia affinis TaxID=143900 RepID=A0AAD7WCI4_9TELE|nr:hypothetical protein AAFF_G00086280 [Aldrovandia affinis]